MRCHNNNERNDERPPADFELTTSEKEALKSLPRERMPDAAVEDRVVQALCERGIVVPSRRRVIEVTSRGIAALAAACLILLATGFALGQWVGSRQIASGDVILLGNGDVSVAATLQQTGSAYLLALDRLAALPDAADSQQAVQGREVALTMLCTAADQLTRLVPKNELAGQLLAAIDTDPSLSAIAGGSDAIGGNRVIEF